MAHSEKRDKIRDKTFGSCMGFAQKSLREHSLNFPWDLHRYGQTPRNQIKGIRRLEFAQILLRPDFHESLPNHSQITPKLYGSTSWIFPRICIDMDRHHSKTLAHPALCFAYMQKGIRISLPICAVALLEFSLHRRIAQIRLDSIKKNSSSCSVCCINAKGDRKGDKRRDIKK